MGIKIRNVEGLRELERALDELPEAVSREVLVKTLTKQGLPIKQAGEALAPKLTGHLAASYAILTKLSRRQRFLNHPESDVEVYIGPGPAAESVQTEFGNAHQAAEPHLRPAFDGNVMKVLEGIRDELAKQIEEARARLARRQNRLINRILAGPDARGIADPRT